MSDHDPDRRSSESGLISVGAVIILAVIGLAIYLLIAATEGDPAYFGSVPVPSDGVPIELDSGEVGVSYAEQVDADALTLPEGLAFSVSGEAGSVLDTSTRTGDPEESDVGAAELFAAVDVDEDGTYFVTATSDETGRAQPALAFGLSPTGAVEARLDDVIDALKGPTGIVVLVALGLLFLLPRAERALKRSRRERSDVDY